MTIANDILSHRIPDFEHYLREGESLDDIDEYGFTPLIETAITKQANIAELLIQRGVDINKPDVTGRTPLHWAVDNNELTISKLLLSYGANPNAYTRAGISPLVYPILRNQNDIKQLLYKHGAKADFPLDFIYTKLIGHRYELKGDVDIVTSEGEFIELDYEGFILEFTVAIVKDALQRFITSFSTRHLRSYFPAINVIIHGFAIADELLKLQRQVPITASHLQLVEQLIDNPMLILPAASRGHAMGFVRYKTWWAKIDRGENSRVEGSINIYQITRLDNFNVDFVQEFLYKKQPRSFFHKTIESILGLRPVAKIPMTSQITGNCSWANIQAIVPVAFALQQLEEYGEFSVPEAMHIYDFWVEWDKDRALDECIQRFHLANKLRKASYAAIIGGILFQSCDASKPQDLQRAERILEILTLPDYRYVLQSYLEVYCVPRLTQRGNNLLKILDDYGYNPNIGVTPIATGLKERK